MNTAQRHTTSSAVWHPARTMQLKGRCRKRLISGWDERLDARFGHGAAGRIRMRLGPDCSRALQHDDNGWIPVYAQLRLAECIADEFFGGDLSRMESLAVEDVSAAAGRAGSFALRRLGVRRAIAMGPRAHSRVYSVGRLMAEVGKRQAQLRFRGADLFSNPTWQALQIFAVRSVFHIVGAEPGPMHERCRPQGFDLKMAW